MAVAAPARVRDAAGYPTDSHRWWVLGVAAMGSMMSILDSTVVNIALPKLMAIFNTDVHGAQWVLTSYLLALALVIPLTGYLDETFGGKRVYIICLILFTAASALCGLAWSLTALIFFRILQGLGGGLIQPLGMSMILKEFPPQERGTAMSFIGIPIMLGPAIGPTFGGYLVQYVDWRLIFYINVPIGILAVILASRILHASPTDRKQRLDLAGIALVGIGSASLLLGIDNGPSLGWGSTEVIAEMIVGTIVLIAFVVVELSVVQPLLELRLFRSLQFSAAVLMTLIVQAALFGGVFLLPVFLQSLRGLGAMQTGMLLIPQSFAVMFTMPIAGRIFDRFGPQIVMLPGIFLLTLATYLFSFLSLNTSNLHIMEVLVLRGVGMGLCMMPATTAAMNAVPRQLIPRATALTNALQRIIGSFGTAIMATVLTARENFQFATMAQTVTPFSPGVHVAMARVQAMAALEHLPATLAQQMNLMMLYQSVALTSAVRAFDDTFYFGTLVCLPAFIAALFVRNNLKRSTGGAPGAAMME